MALSPRQTGSSIKFFILAAAVQAGAQAGDTIDGVKGCELPNPGNPAEPFKITGGAAGSVTNLAQQTWSSINCAFARLSQIVGLNRVVDTTYRMAESTYLYPGQPTSERAKIEPFASYATGANEMSPLDMASGMQTLANEGVHKQPYYIDYITDAEDTRLYTHSDAGTTVFDRDKALATIDILKGVVRSGTGRRFPLDDGRESFGKTGTQQDNTNAWFVGATRQLTTAVWVGDPDAYTSMVGVAEFNAEGVNKVQGGLFPKEIWSAFMNPAHAFLPLLDWDAPPPPERPNARLYLPGNECVLQIVGFQPAPTVAVDPNVVTLPTVPGSPDTVPPETLAPVPIVEAVQVGTTIPPDILDPNVPLPSIAETEIVGPCR
jgi:penicillin-binding protein 1A